HLYASLGQEVRRWSADGLEDAWRFDGAETMDSITHLAVGEDSIAIVGRYTEPGSYEPDYADAFYGALTKTVPAALYEGATHATVQANDYGERVALSPWGGWVAAGSVDDPDHVWLRGFGGLQLSSSLDPHDRPHVDSLI